MKTFRALVILSVMVGSVGCYNAKIRAPVLAHGEKYSDLGASFLWGATNTTTDAIECPHGLAYVESYHPWWGVFLVGPLTLGIVTPIRKVYRCAAPSQPGGAQVVVVQSAGPTATAAPK